MAGRLTGKVALVTGAGTRGTTWGNGKTIAILLAREGARVMLVHRDEVIARDTLSVIESEGGCAAICVADVARMDDVRAMVEATEKQFGRLDILVNNVGLHSHPGLFKESLEDWNYRFAVNVTSVFVAAKSAIPVMLEHGGGRIINISSIAALRSGRVPGYAYSASKAALQRLTKDLALEFAPQGIRANCIVVGMMDTPHSHRAYASIGLSPEQVTNLHKGRDKLSPTGRQGTTWDVAHAALFLAMEESNYINGNELVVDGGYTLLNASAAPP